MAIEIKNFDYNHLIPIWEEYLKKKTELDYTTMYIHIPYCAKECLFCMYDTRIIKKNSIDNLLDSIEKQFQIAQPVFKDEPIKALYVGGGSPSLLTVGQMNRLFKLIEKYWNIEPDNNMFNFEMHPSQITDSKIDLISKSFINRVSMGVQSLNEEVIRANNRIWIPEEKIIDIHQKLIKAFSHKKSRINIDLLHGLSKQSKDSFFYDVKKFISLDAPNITVYSLRDSRYSVRDGKMNIVKGFRPIKDDDVYHEEFIKHVEELKTFLPKKYRWMGTSADNWEEFNSIRLNDERFYFYHTYCPDPLHYNNVISFGSGDNESFFIPINKKINFNEFNSGIRFSSINSFVPEVYKDDPSSSDNDEKLIIQRRKEIKDFNTLRLEYS